MPETIAKLCLVSKDVGQWNDGVEVVDEEIGCLARRDQARLEDAWPAEVPSNESPFGW